MRELPSLLDFLLLTEDGILLKQLFFFFQPFSSFLFQKFPAGIMEQVKQVTPRVGERRVDGVCEEKGLR